MKFNTWIKRLASSVVVLAAISMIGACASLKPSVYHKFSFDGWADRWAREVDLLEYRYEGRGHIIQEKATAHQSLGRQLLVAAQMPVGDSLYVRWRIKSSGEVIERQIMLRGRLPEDMYMHTLTFVIERNQVYVYLVTPRNREGRPLPDLKTFWSRSNETYEIYPRSTVKGPPGD